MILRYYKIKVKIPEAGRYVPAAYDACGGGIGGYREDKYLDFIILAYSAKKAKEIIKKAYPDAKIPECESLGEV